jgi:pantothenate kinase
MSRVLDNTTSAEHLRKICSCRVRRPAIQSFASHAYVLSMETYAIEMNHLPPEERARLNYDAPHATDVRSLASNIREYVAGKAIEAPIYDFAEHLRVSGHRSHIPAKSLLIVEGILALHFAELRPYFDLSIYLDAPDEVCFRRRRVREFVYRREFRGHNCKHVHVPSSGLQVVEFAVDVVFHLNGKYQILGFGKLIRIEHFKSCGRLHHTE